MFTALLPHILCDHPMLCSALSLSLCCRRHRLSVLLTLTSVCRFQRDDDGSIEFSHHHHLTKSSQFSSVESFRLGRRKKRRVLPFFRVVVCQEQTHREGTRRQDRARDSVRPSQRTNGVTVRPMQPPLIFFAHNLTEVASCPANRVGPPTHRPTDRGISSFGERQRRNKIIYAEQWPKNVRVGVSGQAGA